TLSVLAAMFLAQLVVAHRPMPIAALFACMNGIEAAMMIILFRFIWVFPYPNITIGQANIMTALLGIVIPGITALAGGLLLHPQYATDYVQGTMLLWSSHTIGACLVGPPIILFSVKELKRLLTGKYLWPNILLG